MLTEGTSTITWRGSLRLTTNDARTIIPETSPKSIMTGERRRLRRNAATAPTTRRANSPSPTTVSTKVRVQANMLIPCRAASANPPPSTAFLQRASTALTPAGDIDHAITPQPQKANSVGKQSATLGSNHERERLPRSGELLVAVRNGLSHTKTTSPHRDQGDLFHHHGCSEGQAAKPQIAEPSCESQHRAKYAPSNTKKHIATSIRTKYE